MIDRMIAAISPQWALSRQVSRLRLSAIMNYDGARRNYRTNHWKSSTGSANAVISAAGNRLRVVARDMVRNNAHAARAVQVITDSIVGGGIIPTIAHDDPEKRKSLEVMLTRFADTGGLDPAGRMNEYGRQLLALRAVVTDGECLIVRRWRTTAGGKRLPFTIQVIEIDHLDDGRDGPLLGGGIIVNGIEFDATGNRVAYWLFPHHPGTRRAVGNDSVRVLAINVAHVFRPDRPGQDRGASWFAPVLTTMQDFADYKDAQLVRQRIAASLVAFVRKISNAGFAPLGAPAAAGNGTSRSGAPLEALEAGTIEYLGADEDVTFSSPPPVDGYADYNRVTLQEVAIGLGIDYSALTGDQSRNNFASGRLGLLRFSETIKAWFVQFVLPQMLEPIGGWYLEGLVMMGADVEGADILWTPPVAPLYDPQKEIAAARDAIAAGLSSRPHEQRRRGFDPEKLDAEIQESNERADLAGASFTSDGRRAQAVASLYPPEPADL